MVDASFLQLWIVAAVVPHRAYAHQTGDVRRSSGLMVRMPATPPGSRCPRGRWWWLLRLLRRWLLLLLMLLLLLRLLSNNGTGWREGGEHGCGATGVTHSPAQQLQRGRRIHQTGAQSAERVTLLIRWRWGGATLGGCCSGSCHHGTSRASRI